MARPSALSAAAGIAGREFHDGAVDGAEMESVRGASLTLVVLTRLSREPLYFGSVESEGAPASGILCESVSVNAAFIKSQRKPGEMWLKKQGIVWKVFRSGWQQNLWHCSASSTVKYGAILKWI